MKDPAILFYTSDFLTGTAFFTMEQRGQYITLLAEQHQNGHIPENHMVCICLSLDSPVAKKFIKDDNGFYFNERMENEILKRKQFTESRRVNGLKGGRPKEEKEMSKKANEKPLGLPSENLPENENENEEYKKFGVFELIFDEFRKKYPGTKRGNETEFNNFKKKHKDWKDIINLLSELLDGQIIQRNKRKELKQFVAEWKNLQTWINQRCWEEEMIISDTITFNKPITELT